MKQEYDEFRVVHPTKFLSKYLLTCGEPEELTIARHRIEVLKKHIARGLVKHAGQVLPKGAWDVTPELRQEMDTYSWLLPSSVVKGLP